MSDAADVAVEAAFFALLATFAAAQSPALSVAYPNVQFSPPAPSQSACWLRATFLPNEVATVGVNFGAKNQHSGLLQVDVFYAQGAGELAPARIAAKIVAQFKRGTVVTKDGFSAQVTRTPSRFEVLKDDPWAFVPVRIPYSFFAANPA